MIQTARAEKTRIAEIFQRFQAENPQPTTELVYGSVFELLIAVILSAQATDVSVNKATAVLFKVANTPHAILSLGEIGLKRYIQSIGLYNAKTRNILKTCAMLLDKFNGEVPSSRLDLESLPGVGRKTANVILNTAFGEATIAVDTHIFRVSQRLNLAQGKTPEAIEKGLEKVSQVFSKKTRTIGWCCMDVIFVKRGVRYASSVFSPICVRFSQRDK